MKPLALALALDATLGEPPAAVHPVVWMGRTLAWLERYAPEQPASRLMYGLGVAVGLSALWAGVAWLVERFAPWPVQAVVLKAAFAGRALTDAGARVEAALSAGRLEDARSGLRWLVSRPTADLDAGLVAAAGIESLAENFVDSWVAPLASYGLFGLAGAYAVRAANTADAMWGYHTPTYEHLGKAAARLDDALNWLPARLGALLLLLAGSDRRAGFAIWRRDAGRTASPNAGQAMATAAGLLGVRLEKPGYYALHAEAPAPTAADLARARRLVERAMLLAAFGALALRRAGIRV